MEKTTITMAYIYPQVYSWAAPRTDTAQFAWIHGFHGPELVMGCALLVVSFSLFISADAVLFLLVVLYYVIASQILSRFFLKKNLIRNVKNIATSSVL